MPDHPERGAFGAEIPADAVAEALRSVERIEQGGGAEEETPAIEVEAAAGGASSTELESLRAQLELSQAKGRETLEKLRDQHDRLLRAAADLENYKKRAQREREEIQRFGIEKVVKDLLPTLDGLDRALAAAKGDDPLAEGVRLVKATLEAALARHGVQGFSALGAAFDPASHEALMQVPTAEQAPGTVVLEHARGFRLHGRLIRPAMVGVAIAAPPAAPPDGNQST
jgi:molecular chaperone GrpE